MPGFNRSLYDFDICPTLIASDSGFIHKPRQWIPDYRPQRLYPPQQEARGVFWYSSSVILQKHPWYPSSSNWRRGYWNWLEIREGRKVKCRRMGVAMGRRSASYQWSGVARTYPWRYAERSRTAVKGHCYCHSHHPEDKESKKSNRTESWESKAWKKQSILHLISQRHTKFLSLSIMLSIPTELAT